MNHQREEQQNAAQQVRVGVIVRQRAESAACSQADTVFFAECAFHAANPEIDDQCDRENGERVVVHIAGEEHKLRQKTDENTAEQCGFAPFKELFADQKHNDQCAGARKRTLVRRAAVKRAAALFVNSDVMAINTELMIAVRYGYSA